MSIAKKIKELQQKNTCARRNDRQFLECSPLERSRTLARDDLVKVESYRTRVLKTVPVFAGLAEEMITEASFAFETVMYKQGDMIVKEGSIGDCFFILEEGEAQVTKRREFKDQHRNLPCIAVLGPDSFFGEQSLLSPEYQQATITVDYVHLALNYCRAFNVFLNRFHRERQSVL